MIPKITTFEPRYRNLSHFSYALLVLCAIAAVALTACGSGEPAPAGPQPVVNEVMNASFAALPKGFEVKENRDSTLRLELKDPPQDAAAATEMWLEVSERSDFGIEITEIVGQQKALYEAMDGGSFGGNQQLQTPTGRAYYSRGRYQQSGVEVEETRVFQIHPEDNRLVTFHYRYPAGDDSGDRVMELLSWVGEFTGAGQPDPAEDPSAASDSNQ